MKKIISFILVALLLFTPVGCNQNEQMDEMEQRIAQLEKALQNQADVNDELSADLEEQKSANEWLGQLILTQQGLLDEQKQAIDSQQGVLDEQKEVIDSQQKQLDLAEKAIDNLLGKPIEFTAQTPIYDYNLFDDYELIKYFELYPSGDKSNFESFMDYYNTEFREIFDEKHFLLNASEDEVAVNGGQTYGVSAQNIDGEYVNPIIFDNRFVWDEAIKNYMYKKDEEESDIGRLSTVHLTMYLAPLPADYNSWHSKDCIRLEFGELQKEGYAEMYFNIYVGSRCIGTCYYSANATLTYRWFERYFRENMFLGE
ncbi:MAG: hypothetical protein IKC48_03135 [Clostridia bacterium]|nr:hypothetical protein [Clostridia bacterium]